MKIICSDEFSFEKFQEDNVIIYSNHGYKLHYCGNIEKPTTDMHFHFSVKTNNGTKFDISGRNLESKTKYGGYQQPLVEISKKPKKNLQYIEIGAGLGEFVPKITKENNLNYKPMIIDPANYNLLGDMLIYFQNKFQCNKHEEELSELIERCDIISDSSKVILFNKTLSQTLKYHQNLSEKGDIVIDNYGPSFWEGMEKNLNLNQVDKLELKLVRPNGSLYQRTKIIRKKKKDLFSNIWDQL